MMTCATVFELETTSSMVLAALSDGAAYWDHLPKPPWQIDRLGSCGCNVIILITRPYPIDEQNIKHKK